MEEFLQSFGTGDIIGTIGGILSLVLLIITILNKKKETEKTNTDIQTALTEATIKLIDPLNERIDKQERLNEELKKTNQLLDAEVKSIRHRQEQERRIWNEERRDLYDTIQALVQQITKLGQKPCRLPKNWRY